MGYLFSRIRWVYFVGMTYCFLEIHFVRASLRVILLLFWSTRCTAIYPSTSGTWKRQLQGQIFRPPPSLGQAVPAPLSSTFLSYGKAVVSLTQKWTGYVFLSGGNSIKGKNSERAEHSGESSPKVCFQVSFYWTFQWNSP